MNQFDEPVAGFKDQEEPEISLLQLVIAIARHRWMILKIALGTAILGAIVSLLLPFEYTATTTLLPPQQNSSAGAALMSQLGGLGSMASLAGGALGLKNPNDLQVALLQSRTVEDAVVNRFHFLNLFHLKFQSLARKKLERMAKIDSGAKDGLIHISVTDKDAKRSADIANGYVDEFKKFSATMAMTEAAQRRVFFEGQLLQAKDNLAAAEESLKASEQKTGMIQLDSQARAAIELVADLRGQIAAKEVQIAGIKSFATGENPELQLAQQQLAGLQAQLASLGAQGGDLMIPKGSLQQSGLEYVRKVRDVKYYETIFDLLAKQFEIAKVDEAREGSVVQIVDLAVTPDRRSFPQRTLITLGCFIFGLIIGGGWAIAKDGLFLVTRNNQEREHFEAAKRAMSRSEKQKDDTTRIQPVS